MEWHVALAPHDRFAISWRYSMRGFDREIGLLGDWGWLIRKDVGLALSQSGAKLYSGIDYGHVSGRSTHQPGP